MARSSWLGVLFLFLLVVPSGSGQCIDTEAVRVVQIALQEQARGFNSGFVEKQVARLGDSVAVGLIRVLGPNATRDAQMIRAYLPLIQKAFSVPALINNDGNRAPAVTLFVLNSIRASATDDELRSQINRAIEALQKYMQSTHKPTGSMPG